MRVPSSSGSASKPGACRTSASGAKPSSSSSVGVMNIVAGEQRVVGDRRDDRARRCGARGRRRRRRRRRRGRARRGRRRPWRAAPRTAPRSSGWLTLPHQIRSSEPGSRDDELVVRPSGPCACRCRRRAARRRRARPRRGGARACRARASSGSSAPRRAASIPWRASRIAPSSVVDRHGANRTARRSDLPVAAAQDGTRSPSAVTPVTSSSGEPIMKSMWIALVVDAVAVVLLDGERGSRSRARCGSPRSRRAACRRRRCRAGRSGPGGRRARPRRAAPRPRRSSALRAQRARRSRRRRSRPRGRPRSAPAGRG